MKEFTFSTRTVRQLFDLEGKTAVITGGSRGLGLQIAQALGEQGARVAITARKQHELDEAVSLLRAKGIDACAVAADLSREAAVAPLLAAIIERLGHVDILVNNAGATWGAAAEEHPIEAWDKVMNLNVRSVFLLTQAVGKQSMIPRRQGRIINVASVTGLRGNAPGTMKTAAYNTSKAAVINLTRVLAGEWGLYGITVNAIAPGFFPTRMTAAHLEKESDGSLQDRAPLQRLGDDEDLKGAAVLFASDAGKHITGQVLAVDGGVTAVL
ncbi:SDR family oxidoreductase [Ramlibacter solisilvae]|uniref:Gluconate 5-dehydrogenase n=1 Tax=Ramlibacter tataouinensis TaxID=94132 RepID=A0A127JXE1_9BURK|nr:SDR family oxidoreductase [Ramlibacter tataouinensis]AMO22722.1 gluconate 5-dehydrogenase [Ramlibacter tataouinensis]